LNKDAMGGKGHDPSQGSEGLVAVAGSTVRAAYVGTEAPTEVAGSHGWALKVGVPFFGRVALQVSQ
jgi:hypothetical protein